ncbi:MAG: GntR family transcriptional regulator [Kiritimatiellae bacterium]|nr:GntR family transcriptional regulator [Kiritimatiellia bacterium]
MARIPETVLSRDKPEPLHRQAREAIRAMLRGFKPGAPLPRERDLAQTWGVSRITIRNAYAALVHEGAVVRTHKAYRAAPRPSNTGLFMLDGFTRDAVKRGHKPSTEVLGIELVHPEKRIAEALLIKPGERAYRLARKRFLNDIPIAVEYAYLSERLTPGLDGYCLKSLYALLKRRYGIVVSWAEQFLSIRAEPCPEHALLGLPSSQPLLWLRRVSFSDRNVPVEYVQACYNVREFEFYIALRRGPTE